MTQTDTSLRRLAEEIGEITGTPYPAVIDRIESALTTLATSYEERIKALEYQLDVRTSEVEVWATRFNSAATQIREEDARIAIETIEPEEHTYFHDASDRIAAAIRARQEKP